MKISRKADNVFKTITISAIWISVGVSSFTLGFFTLGLAIFAWLATYTIVEA